ncbi:MAG: T9SS type A sorting domain-containing protein [Sphingobacteriales bacterium]|nr:MAG: T9SS type A sorting domain-containing protein [Sphingobacteriales bacterium]
MKLRSILTFVALLGLQFLLSEAGAQTITTTGTTNSSLSGTASISFVVENTNTNAVLLTDLSSLRTTASNGVTYTLWYSATSLSGTSTVATPAWTQIATIAPANVTASAISPIFSGLSFVIPAGTSYRFALMSTGTINYTTGGTNSTASGGINVFTGNHTIGGSNVGYSGSGGSLGTTPRYFVGTLVFTPLTPCVAPPTAGNSVASLGTICLGSQVTLNLSGHSIGLNQTYQLQSSATSTGTYTNLGASTADWARTITPSNTMWYRMAVTCGTSTTFSAPVQVTVNTILPGGDYTINSALPASATNFTSFTNAVNVLKCGITGPVTFTVANGAYNEQIDIPAIVGASATARIRFKAASSNAGDVMLNFSSTSAADNYVVRLTNASFITFDGISIENNGTAFGRAIEMIGTASKDSIKNCIVRGGLATVNNVNTATIYAEDMTGTENVIVNNAISRGAYGIRFAGTSTTNLAANWIIDNNSITDAFTYGAYLYYTSNTKFRNNTISTLSTATNYGVYGYYNDSAFEVTGNKVTAIVSGDKHGIYLYNSDGDAAVRPRVANNVIAVGDGSSTVSGLRIYNSSYLDAYNNSVYVNTDATGYAAYIYHSAAANSNNNIKNNIFYNSGTGYAMFIYNINPSLNNSIDYNNLYAASGVLIDQSTPALEYRTLQEWRTASGMDMNSISYNPGFTSITDLTPNPANPASWSVNGRGVHIPGNSKDINGGNRVTVLADGVPDLGAYEFTPTAIPPAADAYPALPVNGVTQHFLFGQDTVAVLDWSATSLIPSTITVRQYTGTIAPALTSISGGSFAYFYTDIDVPATTYDFNARIHYNDSWMGTISSEANMRMAKRFNPFPWVAYNNTESASETARNVISASGLTSHGFFTGIDNGNVFSSHVRPLGKVVFCPGGNVTLSATPAASGHTYQWKLNGLPIPGAVLSTHTVQTAGLYEVEVANGAQIAQANPVEVYVVQTPSTVVSALGSSRFCTGGSLTMNVQTSTDAKYQWRKNGVDIPAANASAYTATDAGIYTVRVTNLGCAATSSATNITIGAPIVNLGRDTTYCQQSPLVLNASNPGARYIWNTGDTTRTITINTNTSGVYVVRVIAGPGCETTDTIALTVDPAPTVVGVSYVRSGSTYQLSPSGAQHANRYLWIFGDGKTDTNRVITYNYSYRPGSVKLVVFNGCGSDTAEADLTLSVSDIAGKKNAQLNVYPNPAQSFIMASIEGDVMLKEVHVINHLGQVVYRTQNEVNTKEHKIDISYLPNGHYIMRVLTVDNNVINKQFDVLR